MKKKNNLIAFKKCWSKGLICLCLPNFTFSENLRSLQMQYLHTFSLFDQIFGEEYSRSDTDYPRYLQKTTTWQSICIKPKPFIIFNHRMVRFLRPERCPKVRKTNVWDEDTRMYCMQPWCRYQGGINCDPLLMKELVHSASADIFGGHRFRRRGWRLM